MSCHVQNLLRNALRNMESKEFKVALTWPSDSPDFIQIPGKSIEAPTCDFQVLKDLLLTSQVRVVLVAPSRGTYTI